MAIAETRGLTKIYGEGETTVVALDHVDISIDPGEFVAVMGPSGCGKSTLLNLIGGLDTPTEGSVILDGQEIAAMSDDQITKMRRKHIGFVFQFFNLIPVLTAVENAALPLILDKAGSAAAIKKAEEWLARVGLEGRSDNRPDQLSGGQQQRVADEWNRAILMVTHDPRVAASAERIVFMRDGRIVEDAKVDGMESAKAAMERAGLL